MNIYPSDDTKFFTACQTPGCAGGITPRDAKYIYEKHGKVTKHCWLCRQENAIKYKKEHDKQQKIVDEQYAKNPTLHNLH